MLFSSPQSNTVIVPPIFRTIRFLEPIFVSLGGSKTPDSTVLITASQQTNNSAKDNAERELIFELFKDKSVTENRLAISLLDVGAWAALACCGRVPIPWNLHFMYGQIREEASNLHLIIRQKEV